MMSVVIRWRNVIAGMLVATLLAACAGSTSSVQRAGYYTVKKGDTLYSIGRRFNQTPYTIARWNNLPNTTQIEVGQVLRVAPEGRSASTSASSRTTTAKKSSSSSTPVQSSAAQENRARAIAAANAEKINWMWPTPGQRAPSADRNKKGVDIAGSLGQNIAAAADGTVIYSGNGIRGYGNMVIVKHSNAWLSVYAHNRNLLVKEGQQVKRGQKIAEMGNSDSTSVKLYFELRRNGESVNPTEFLP